MTPESKLKKRCRDYVEERFEGRLVHVSAKSVNGFPDSLLLIPGCPTVLVEFKKNKLTRLRPAQDRWAIWLISNNVPFWAIGEFDDFVVACENHWIDRARRSAAAAARSRGLANG